MSDQKQSVATARRALWFAGMLILLAGVVGMHGLNSHAGGMGHGMSVAMPGPVGAAMHAAPAPAGELVATVVHDVAGATTSVEAAVAESVPRGAMGMTAMCMAVLTMALTVLLRMLGGAPTLPFFTQVSAMARALVPHGRDPDPPSLTVLSIRRC